MKHFIVTVSLMAFGASALSQTHETRQWEQYYERLYNIDDVEGNNISDIYEQLCEIEDNKIEINNATEDDLRRLPFLNEQQIEEIVEYVYRYKPLRTLDELAMIETLDKTERELLKCFLYIGPIDEGKKFPTPANILKYGKNEIVATARIPFYDRAGDKQGYLGYKYKHWLRYKFHYGQFFQIGITGAQDSGEPFFGSKNKYGYDFYSYYALARNLGKFKTIALGLYRVKFGLGLIMNNGFNFGKLATQALTTPANTVSAYSSRTEAKHLQGAAATLAISNNVDVTAFVSYRKIDATLTDSGSIKTILTTGYHRTESELERKHNSSQFTTGGNIAWHHAGFHAATSALYTSFNRMLTPDIKQLYRRYYPQGNRFWNASISYGYTSSRLNINGETATNNTRGIATINSVSFSPTQILTLIAIQRYYSYKYYSLYGASFSDGGRVQNESGIYIGANWKASPNLTVSMYGDYAYFPWARYGTSSPSHSLDNNVSATYTTGNVSLYARYRFRLRQSDAVGTTSIADKNEHRARFSCSTDMHNWNFKTQLDMAYAAQNNEGSFGWMLSETAAYRKSFLNISANINYFKTKNYASRLYTYERGMLYSFSFPSFFGHGIRLGAFANADINAHIAIAAKIGLTKYFDRQTISSALQEIDKSYMTDLDIQARFRF